MMTFFGFDFCLHSSRLFAISPFGTGDWLQLLQASLPFSSFLFNFYSFWMSFLRFCYTVFGEVFVWVNYSVLLLEFFRIQSFFFIFLDYSCSCIRKVIENTGLEQGWKMGGLRIERLLWGFMKY